MPLHQKWLGLIQTTLNLRCFYMKDLVYREQYLYTWAQPTNQPEWTQFIWRKTILFGWESESEYANFWSHKIQFCSQKQKVMPHLWQISGPLASQSMGWTFIWMMNTPRVIQIFIVVFQFLHILLLTLFFNEFNVSSVWNYYIIEK